MRIYLPENKIFTEALLRVEKSLCIPKMKSITVLLYNFSTMNDNFLRFC